MVEAYLWDDGRIFTGQRWCEALLVEDGRVVYVGSSSGAHRRRPTGAETFELHGRVILPGLIDAHLHLAEITRAREEIDLTEVSSIADLRERIRARIERHPARPVLGRGWSAERLAERRAPTARDLDAAAPGRPVILIHASGHAAVASSAALEAAGIDVRSPDPPDGRYGRGPDGEPNGIVYEAAMRPLSVLVARLAPPTPEGLRRTLGIASSLGLTTVVTMNTGPEELAALRSPSVGRSPSARIRCYLRLAALGSFPVETIPDAADLPKRFRVAGVKGFTDGAFGPRTAWLADPYSDAPESAGMPLGGEAEFRAGLEEAAERGLAPALHAIGDRALARALDLLDGRRGRTAAPPRVEHAALTPPGLLAELARIRPVLGVQPGFLYSDWWLEDRLGADRARWAYAFRTLLDRGLVLAGSSDAPYDPIDPWRGLRAAVDRSDPAGRSANPLPAEALAPEEAVRLYTIGGATSLGEPWLGSLEEGAEADLVVLAAPRLEAALAEGARTVEETWLGGRRVYHARESRGTVKR